MKIVAAFLFAVSRYPVVATAPEPMPSKAMAPAE